MAKQVQIGINDIPEGWNHNAADFINKLIQRKPENRLGHKTIQELFHHHWFDGFPWDDLKKNPFFRSPLIFAPNVFSCME